MDCILQICQIQADLAAGLRLMPQRKHSVSTTWPSVLVKLTGLQVVYGVSALHSVCTSLRAGTASVSESASSALKHSMEGSHRHISSDSKPQFAKLVLGCYRYQVCMHDGDRCTAVQV